MKKIILVLILMFTSNFAFAADDLSLPAVSGYDVVAYFTEGKAVKGSGFNVAEHEGQSYIFANKENKAKFVANPSHYLPQYGGWCAYGASLGKKFYVDATVFEVVDDKLYLNLDSDIQKKWDADQAELIKKADANWPKIKDKEASSL